MRFCVTCGERVGAHVKHIEMAIDEGGTFQSYITSVGYGNFMSPLLMIGSGQFLQLPLNWLPI